MKTRTVNLGPVEAIALGHGMCFVVVGKEIAVFRSRAGKLFAVSNRCPHRQGPLVDGVIDDAQVICPLHGHKFDLTTGHGSETGECVKTYRVWEENGQLILGGVQ
ncbi:MAG: nitrite reductase (NAD(P)H) small subunit [Candidatus Omnitrophica bacterium]|nr:nitrite reductase (NAD(P)H) small subunit [Candidatus Omnitrophota bacterium]